MKSQIVLSGLDGATLTNSLRISLKRTKPKVICIASAFVSMKGLDEIRSAISGIGIKECRLIAGIDNAVTHPEALYQAKDLGWNLRLGSSSKGIFHPKIIVAGKAVSRAGKVAGISCLYVGSSNLTLGGFKKNIECGLIADAEACPDSASTAFAALWGHSRTASAAELRNYAALFAEASRRRSVTELQALGVSDEVEVTTEVKELRRMRPPENASLRSDFAMAAWAGLQSFTGDYSFQVEFPKAAGQVIANLIRANNRTGSRVDVLCTDDNSHREMHYGFYADNSMFRLNIPNDVPGVSWAREHKDGIAFVERGPQGGAPLRLRVLKPGAETNEIIGRSVALGTWGRTPTRTYGWY